MELTERRLEAKRLERVVLKLPDPLSLGRFGSVLVLACSRAVLVPWHFRAVRHRVLSSRSARRVGRGGFGRGYGLGALGGLLAAATGGKPHQGEQGERASGSIRYGVRGSFVRVVLPQIAPA